MHHDFIDKYSNLDSPVHRIDSRVKIVFFFSLILICVSTPIYHIRAFFLYFLILIAILTISKIPILHVLRKSLVIIPFVLIIALFIPFTETSETVFRFNDSPDLMMNRWLLFWNVLVKAFISIITLILLNSVTRFDDTLKSLSAFRFPIVLINMLSFFYRYIFVIIDEAERMQRALVSRLFRGRSLIHAKVIGDLLAILFLRSYERGERVYLAMCARGWDGQLLIVDKKPLILKDSAALIIGLAALLLIRLWSV
ncbi:cobalt ECF transporter T component CbiQ [bacterium]|nr:cobalt ECF transporter T component CbiQ [FCB group bacterium]MBL7190228.1 cobalt ECF transporter T component CbiQ [bacterium]